MARSPRKRPKSSSVAILLAVALIACNREPEVSRAPTPKAKPATASASTDTSAARAEVGDVMPSYSAKFLDGKPFNIAAERGNVVLLNVWATWCGPCRFEIPELQALHQKYGARGLKIVGVSVDEGGDDAVRKFVGENKMTYPIAVDAESQVANVLRTTVIPTSVLIGRDGRIVWRKIGPVLPNETAAVDSTIQKALGKTSS